MKKIDHVRKTVYIIVGILTIISLVFSLCKKVGLCAGSSSSPIYYDGDFPLFFDSSFYDNDVFSPSVVLSCVDDAINRNNNFSSGDLVIAIGSLSNNSNQIRVFFPSMSPSNVTLGIFNGSSVSFSIYGTCKAYYYTNSGSYMTSSDLSSSAGVVSLYETSTQEIAYKLGTNVNNQLLYAYNYSSYFYDNKQIFSVPLVEEPSDPPFSGHSKGGVLSNYIDSHDMIEDSSDIPQVDVTPPADPTTNNLLQKILNGLGVINGSIQSGVLTIGDYIGQGFQNVIDWFTEPFDQEAFSDELNEIALINDFSNLKTLVENCGMFDWSDVSPAQSVSWTFDFGGAVLPHTSTTIDFSWYTGTVKNICVAVICTFLVLGLLVTIINQLPNIIGGKSGDKGGGSDS